MIFTLELNFRNCPACKKKVEFSMDQCENCHTPFSAKSNQMIMQIQQETRQRMQFLWNGGKADPNQVRFSKFYVYRDDAYHHIFGIPLYTLEEALIVQNLMYQGNRTNRVFWIASFCSADQDGKSSMVHLLSWQALRWDEDQQIYLAGPDEGPRTVLYTPWE